MLHLILLVLCWIFVAVVSSIEAAQNVEGAWGSGPRPDFLGRIFTVMGATMGMGTMLWVLLEAIYEGFLYFSS